jgi:molecular chaperone Hsp33
MVLWCVAVSTVFPANSAGDLDRVTPFQVLGLPVLGRIVRLGADSLDPILRRHAYPPCIARLLGEALTLASLVGTTLKFEGRLVIQTQGEGAVPLLVAEYRSDGCLRGYARMDTAKLALLPERPSMIELLGVGAIAFTIDQGPDMTPYQGLVALEGESLAQAAQAFFFQSDQVATRVALAVAEVSRPGEAPYWISGGAMLQQVAGDTSRGETELGWERARALFDTLQDQELADPALPLDRLLYRLFHEDGVARYGGTRVFDGCSCAPDRLAAVIARLDAQTQAELIDPDGKYRAKCQFCAREHVISPDMLHGLEQ